MKGKFLLLNWKNISTLVLWLKGISKEGKVEEKKEEDNKRIIDAFSP